MVCDLSYNSAVDLRGWREREAGMEDVGFTCFLLLSAGVEPGDSGVHRLRDSDGLGTSSLVPLLPLPCIDSLYLGDRQVGIPSREKNILIYQVSLGSDFKGPRDRLSNAVLGYPDQ